MRLTMPLYLTNVFDLIIFTLSYLAFVLCYLTLTLLQPDDKLQNFLNLDRGIKYDTENAKK